MLRRLIASAALALSGVAAGGAAGEPTYYTFIQRVPPYTVAGPESGPAHGLVVDVVNGALAAAKLPVEARSHGDSWTALQDEGRATANSLIAPFARTPQREKSYHWIAEILDDKLYAYVKRGRAAPNSFAEVAKEKSIGATAGSSAESRLKDLKLKFKPATTPRDAFRMLVDGEVQVVLAQDFVSVVELRALGAAGESVQHGEPLVRVPLWVATSPKTSTDDLLKARTALEKFKGTPEYKRILESYRGGY